MYRAVAALCAGIVLLAGTGCAVRAPQTYRLSQHKLIPPGVAGPQVSRRTVIAEVSLNQPRCTDGGAGIEIRRRGKHARVTVAREALIGRPPGWLADWTITLESQGCIADGEGLKLAARIAEALPLDLSADFRLLHVDESQSAYLDIGPENRLQVDSPILREATPAGAPIVESARITGLSVEVKTSANLIGYESAWYGVHPKPRGSGFAIVPLYAESHIQGSVDRLPRPRVDYLRFAPDAAFYRIFYRSDRTIILLSSPTRAELTHATRTLNEDPRACAALPAQTCVLIPNKVGVNADIVAIVNGRELALPVGSRLSGAIRAAGEEHPESLLPRLSVLKRYGGKLVPLVFDAGNTGILGLTLLGGEEISWR